MSGVQRSPDQRQCAICRCWLMPDMLRARGSRFVCRDGVWCRSCRYEHVTKPQRQAAQVALSGSEATS